MVWRNKSKEEQVQKLGKETIPDKILEECDCVLACDKQRNGEWEGKIALWFHQESFQYLESYSHKPLQMISYSMHG